MMGGGWRRLAITDLQRIFILQNIIFHLSIQISTSNELTLHCKSLDIGQPQDISLRQFSVRLFWTFDCGLNLRFLINLEGLRIASAFFCKSHSFECTDFCSPLTNWTDFFFWHCVFALGFAVVKDLSSVWIWNLTQQPLNTFDHCGPRECQTIRCRLPRV
ncbi:hypothetical protein niasHT_027683 [Heterodera trifolii]|uniref:Uncharacterized protein n=1 Tax=Heterodera trifolii TaxID=157864 RepID=A0ABD2KA58_9BILA